MTEGGRAKGNGPERYSEGTLDDTDNIQDLKDDAFLFPWDKQLKTVDGKEVVNYKPYFSGSKPPRIQTKFGLFTPLSNGNGIKLNFWNTIPMCSARNRSRRRELNEVMSVPKICKVPLLAFKVPANKLSRVDFPLPEAP